MNVRRVQVTIKFDSSQSYVSLAEMLHRLGFANLEITEFYDVGVE